MTAPLRTAVVGLGFGQAHVSEALSLDSVVLSAVVDPRDPRTDERLTLSPDRETILATPHYETVSDVLRLDRPDIIALATPIHTHAELAALALASDVHVLLEKPPTATLAEHVRLVESVRESGSTVQVGFQARGSHSLEVARDLIESGQIGDVVRIAAVGRWSRSRAYYRRAAWAGRRYLGRTPVMDGAMTNPFAHAVDVALTLDGAYTADDIAEVEIDAWHAHDIETDDTTSASITTARGTSIVLALTLCAEQEEPSPVVKVIGSRGEVRVFYTEDRVEVAADTGDRVIQVGRTSLLANLADHINGGAELLSSLNRTGAFMAVLEAARISPPPRPIPDRYVTWSGEGDSGRPSVADVDRWCALVASTGLTFTRLGAPWTVSAPLPVP